MYRISYSIALLQLCGVRPFLSDKYDLTRHPNYRYTTEWPWAQVLVSGALSTFWKVTVRTTLLPMLMYGKVSQENYVELTAASAIPNKEIKSPQILRY